MRKQLMLSKKVTLSSKLSTLINKLDLIAALITKIGLLVLYFMLGVFILWISIRTINSEGIIIDKILYKDKNNENLDLAPVLLDSVSNQVSKSIGNIHPLFSQLSEDSKLKFELGGSELYISEIIKFTKQNLSKTKFIDGDIIKLDEGYRFNLRLNKTAIPSDGTFYKSIDELLPALTKRIIAITQPIIFAQNSIDNFESLNILDKNKSLSNDISTIDALMPFYTNDLKTQAYVAKSNLLQVEGDLPKSIHILKKTILDDPSNPLLRSELALRSYFASNDQVSLSNARVANNFWNHSYSKILSNNGFIAIKARNDELAARFQGNYKLAYEKANLYYKNESSDYDALDVKWESLLYKLKNGDYSAALIESRKTNQYIERAGMENEHFVEGPAELNMNLALIKKDWKYALENAKFADDIHVCEEPTKQYQRAAIHKPWIDFLKYKSNDKSSYDFKIVDSPYNKLDDCYLCLRLNAHRMLAIADEFNNPEEKFMKIDAAKLLFDKAIAAAPDIPFAYLERALLIEMAKKNGFSLMGDSKKDINQSKKLGKQWLPILKYDSFKADNKYSKIFDWTFGYGWLAPINLHSLEYLNNDKLKIKIDNCIPNH